MQEVLPSSPLYFSSELGQVLCRECRVAVAHSKESMQWHLAKGRRHRQVLLLDRKRWVEEQAQQTQRAVSEAAVAAKQPDGRLEVEGLATVWGCRCLECGERSVSEKMARQHQIKQHAALTANGRRRAGQVLLWASEWMQSVFGPRSKHYHLFAVRQRQRVPAVDGALTAAGGMYSVGEQTNMEDAYEGVQQLFQEAEQMRTMQQQEQTLSMVGKEEETPWLNRMGWLEHLEGMDLKVIGSASTLPGGSEQGLKTVCTAAKVAIDRCLHTLAQTDRETRQWWQSAKPDQISLRPLESLRTSNAYGKYLSYWQRFLVYCVRMVEVAPTVRWSQHRLILNDRQQDLLFAMLDEVRVAGVDGYDSERQVQTVADLVQCFADSVLQEKFRGPGWSNPLVHFTAVLGINEYSRRLKQPADYTSTLAGLIYCCRLFLLRSCTLQDKAREQALTKASTASTRCLPPASLTASSTACFEQSLDYFRHFRHTWLTNGSYCAMSRMLGDLAYGMNRARESSGQARVYWEDPKTKTKLNFEGRTVTADALSGLVQHCLQEAREVLWKSLLFTDNCSRWFDLDLVNRNENLTLGQSSTSSSFLSGCEDANVMKGASFVQQRLFENDEARHHMLAGPANNSGKCWKFSAIGVYQYKQHLKQFLNLLFVLMHITGGAPARGTEIGCLRHRDGQAVDRNIFVVQGQVVFITHYHKGMVMSDKLKVIPRFLPSAVGALLALYLTYVQPFVANIDLTHQGPPESDYLWSTSKGTSWETERMSKALSDCSERWMGVRLTLRSYRQIAVAFSRDVVHVQRLSAQQFQNFQNEDELLDKEEKQEDAAALQTAHSIRSRTTHYAVPTDSIARLTLNSLEIFAEVSAEWHRFLKVEQEQEAANSEQGVANNKRRRSTAAANNTMGLSIRSEQLDQGLKRQRSHTFLPNSNHEAPSTVNVCGNHIPVAGAGNQKQLECNIYKILKTRFGWQSFKSVQQLEALVAIFKQTPALAVVIPTGGGKSLLFMLPAIMEREGVSIVVIPFVSLVSDLRRRCKQLAIDVVEWTPDSQKIGRIILISVERAVSAFGGDGENRLVNFLQFASVLHAGGQLKRIYFDECHTIVSQEHFRPAMAKLFQLLSLAVPAIFLSATLPPSIILQFEQAMGLTSVCYIRSTEFRTNIKAEVKWCASGRAVTVAVELVKQMVSKMFAGQKIVVYCRSIAVCKRMAGEKLLDCPCYHSELSDAERSDCLNRWMASNVGCLVSTTSFGNGVDVAGIVWTVHVNMPFGLVDFIQESGRAGRRGEQSTSTVIVEERERGVAELQQQFQGSNVRAMQRYVQTLGCRTLVATQFLNGGNGQRCDEISSVLCDNCENRAAGIKNQTVKGSEQRLTVIERKIARERTGLSRLEELVSMVGDGVGKLCPVCYIERGPGDARHRFLTCQANSEVTFEKCCEFSRTIRWVSNSGICWRCGLWENACSDGLKKKEERSGCLNRWVVVACAMMARCYGPLGV